MHNKFSESLESWRPHDRTPQFQQAAREVMELMQLDAEQEIDAAAREALRQRQRQVQEYFEIMYARIWRIAVCGDVLDMLALEAVYDDAMRQVWSRSSPHGQGG